MAPSLSQADHALATFAESLTLWPGEPGRPRVRTLRDAGFDDPAILLATEITGYFNFVNRLVTGLGVTLEDADDYRKPRNAK